MLEYLARICKNLSLVSSTPNSNTSNHNNEDNSNKKTLLSVGPKHLNLSNLSTWEVEAGGLGVKGYPQLWATLKSAWTTYDPGI